MKKNIKNKTAFSLIELSIVILIVGIVVAGVTQSSRLISAFRLNTARNLTQSSPVASIKDLSVWYEASGENSFLSSEQDDGAQITTWYDINPQSTSKNTLTHSASARITYEASGINNLPALYFDGNTTTTEALAGNVIVTTNYTFFLVLRLDDTVPSSVSESRYAFSNGNSASSGMIYGKWGNPGHVGKRIFSFSGASWNDTTTANATSSPEIIYAIADSTTITAYVNGTQQTLTAPGTLITPSGTLRIGNDHDANGDFWKGLIAEVIFFERKLKAEEVTAVKNYLAKKYNITVS